MYSLSPQEWPKYLFNASHILYYFLHTDTQCRNHRKSIKRPASIDIVRPSIDIWRATVDSGIINKYI